MKGWMSCTALLAVLGTTGGGAFADDHGSAACPHAAGAGALTRDQTLQIQAGSAERAANPEVILTGEIVDGACLASHGGFGPAHSACAARGLADGDPMFVRLQDGKALLLLVERDRTELKLVLRNLVGRSVDLKGTRSDRGGLTVMLVTAAQPAL